MFRVPLIPLWTLEAMASARLMFCSFTSRELLRQSSQAPIEVFALGRRLSRSLSRCALSQILEASLVLLQASSSGGNGTQYLGQGSALGLLGSFDRLPRPPPPPTTTERRTDPAGGCAGTQHPAVARERELGVMTEESDPEPGRSVRPRCLRDQ
ncbi:hypothetical protein AAFF_G00095540 [Aldrovandia affinis]|uniref:Uncharacterized protein n=1 Tax=Aldrovandia affinis TaxID=143900 RepID=A0AAD7WC38_9TELE|nr:hypothetical protein AAFF_G00095540 [Aldrovandia affinis]